MNLPRPRDEKWGMIHQFVQSNGHPYSPYQYSNSAKLNNTSKQPYTPEYENQQQTTIGNLSVLSGAGRLTHNVTRMLSDTSEPMKQVPVTSSHAAPFSTAHFLSFRQQMLNENHRPFHDKGDMLDTRNSSNISTSTDRSDSPGTPSSRSSPISFESLNTSNFAASPSTNDLSSVESSPSSLDRPSSAETSSLSDELNTESSECSGGDLSSSTASSKRTDVAPRNKGRQTRKTGRTNYTNEQIQALLKIFHETPYPDSEMMENIGKDLDIPEKNVKIWFQNKRARWRKRVNDNMNNLPQPYFPMSPMLSPVTPYGFMPTGHMMTSSPVSRMSGYNPFVQESQSLNNQRNNIGHFVSSHGPPNLHERIQSTSLQNRMFPGMSMTSFVPTSSSAKYSQTLSQPSIAPNRTRHQFQYPTQSSALFPTY